MTYTNLVNRIFSNEEFLEASTSQLGTWLRVLISCSNAENSGFVTGCFEWTDLQWLRFCGLKAKEVLAPNPLLEWQDKDLAVKFYPVGHEETALANRKAKQEAGRRGGIASGEKRRERASENHEAQLEAQLEPKGKENQVNK